MRIVLLVCYDGCLSQYGRPAKRAAGTFHSNHVVLDEINILILEPSSIAEINLEDAAVKRLHEGASPTPHEASKPC